jgi:2-amino-4-hydroxy-6-hydroxymethyldihydropteridine diphosphokinase
LNSGSTPGAPHQPQPGRAPTPVAIALGSNLGDRTAHLQFAVNRLRTVLADTRVSSWRETAPVGVEPQPLFLNGVVTGDSRLDARALLATLLELERERGRERPHPGAARTLDLDLILYGQTVIDEPGLRVPHPRFRERLFVLAPLAEIAGDWIDPGSGLTVRQLLARKKAECG